MQGKYTNWPQFLAAYAHRQLLRSRIKSLVRWPNQVPPQDGCTAIIGMCHRLPNVLLGNLRCLDAAAWPQLAEAIVVVDSVQGCLRPGLEEQAQAVCMNIPLRFEYYTNYQARVAERIRLPYVFAWLSWSIGVSLCRTRHALLHDYDALVLDDALARRYEKFRASDAVVQGIAWYNCNGVVPEDRLATTFEAFLKIGWLREFDPIQMFNQVGLRDGRSRDYDVLLEIQHRYTPPNKRSVEKMPEESLVHPSQMIHQYTVFRRGPETAQPCFAIPMIPFFEWFSGEDEAIERVTERLRARCGAMVDMFGDGVSINLVHLSVAQVDWALKQMVRVCISSGIVPERSLYAYGVELYTLAGADEDEVWAGDFTGDQRDWIEKAHAR